MGIALYPKLCTLCKHRQGWTCAAYPQGIPLEIREMYVDHRQPYAGDNGIQFEAKDDSPETKAQLAQVKLRKGRVPAGRNALDGRVAAVRHLISWSDARQKRRFARTVQAAASFEELPEWCQQLVREAEGKAQVEDEAISRKLVSLLVPLPHGIKSADPANGEKT